MNLDTAERSAHFANALAELNGQLTPRYEEIFWASGPSRLAIACAGMIRFGVRSSSVISHLARHGFSREAAGLLRASIENTSNLLYILYVGPNTDDGNPEHLVEQYLCFGETQWQKNIDKSLILLNRDQLSREIASLFDEVKMRADSALEDHPSLRKSLRWHSLSFSEMLNKVIENMPPYLTSIPEFWSGIPGKVAMANSLLHASSFTMARDHASVERGKLLNQDYTPNPEVEFYAAYLAFLNWQVVAETFCEDADAVGHHFLELLGLGVYTFGNTKLVITPDIPA